MKYSCVVLACIFVIVLSVGVQASRIELNATSCSGATSCSTANLNLNNTDIGFNVDTGETGSIFWTNRSISNNAEIQQVGIYIRHAAEGNKIDGFWTIALRNESDASLFCTNDTIAHSQNDKGDFWNTTSACSWTPSRIKQLQTDFASGDSPPGAAAYLYHVEIFVDYLDVPSWTVNMDDNPDPITQGNNLNFTATGTDSDGDNYRMTVCSTNAITDGYPGTCVADTLCTSAATTSGSQTSCVYNTSAASDPLNAYGFLCDAGLQKCSESTSTSTQIEAVVSDPFFGDYYDNNASFVLNGIAFFNVTINNTNGTAFLEFNGINYSVSNTTKTSYNLSLNVSNSGTYKYYWGAWQSPDFYNVSGSRYYTINASHLLVDFVSPTLADSSITNLTLIDINATIVAPYPKQIVLNWNGTNFTFYNESLEVLYNFENLSALSESGSRVRNLARDAVLSATPNTVDGDPIVNSTGYHGGGYHGDGLGGDGIRATSVVGKFSSSGERFTFATWLKPGNVTGIQDGSSFLMGRDQNLGHPAIYIPGTMRVELTKDDTAFVGRSDFSLPIGEWNHLAVTYNGSDVSFYLNGILNNTVTSVQTFSYLGASFLAAKDRTSRFYNGSLDDLWVFNRTLNETDIQQLYFITLGKYDKDHWRLYSNQSRNTTTQLGNGTYTMYVYANTSTEQNATDYRTITINTSYVPPEVSYPNITLNSPAADQTFPQATYSVTLNYTVSSNATFDLRVYATNATNAGTIHTHGLVGKYLGVDGINASYNLTAVPVTPQTGLVVLLHLDNESFGGISQNETNLYNYAGFVNSTAYATNYTNGKFGWGYGVHNDNDEYILVNLSNIEYTNLTIATWFYPKSFTTSADYIFGHSTASTPQNRIQLYTDDASGLLDLGLGGSHALDLSIRDLNLDEWYHFLLTMDSGTYKLYVNGELNTSGTYSSFSGIATGMHFGNNGLIGGSTVEEGNGIFDDIAIWNRSLSASEARAVYQLRNDTYTWAVNATDPNKGSEEIRNFSFGSIVVPNPLLTLLNPQNITYARNTSIPLSYSATNAQACWYALDGGNNNTLAGCSNTVINVSLGQHVLRLYANNSNGVENDTSNVTFVASAYPFYSGEVVSPESPFTFVEQQKYSFNITWTDYDDDLDTVMLTREGINYTPNLEGGAWNYSFTNLSAIINQTYANFSAEGEINFSDHVDFSIGGTNFTVTAWIRPGKSGSTRFAFGKGIAGDYEWGVSHSGNTNATSFTAYTAAGATANTISTGTNSTLQDEWSFVAFNYEEGVELSAFANYEYIDTDTSWGATASSGGDADMLIGSRVPGDSGERWNGSIDDVRIYSEKIHSAGLETIRNSIWRTKRVAVPFVNFHQYVADYSGADTLYMNESAMRDYLSFLNNLSYVSVTDVDFINFSRGEKNYTTSNRPIIFIWDDGKDDLMDVAPVMAEYGYKGVASIITDRVGDAGYVTWDNLITLVNVYNWSIASHTAAHCYAAYSSQANLNCSDEVTLTGNLSGSKQAIIDNVGVTPYTFVHPYNAWNATSMRFCAQYYTMCIGSPYQDGKATYNYIESNFTNGELVRTSISVVDEYTLEKEWTYNFSYNLESLVAHWKLDENNGTDVYDSSGGGHTGAFVDTVLWETDGNTRPHEYYWWANDSRGYANKTDLLYYLVNPAEAPAGEQTFVNASVGLSASEKHSDVMEATRKGLEEVVNRITSLRNQALDKLLKQPFDFIANVVRRLLGIESIGEDFSLFDSIDRLKGNKRGVGAVVEVTDVLGDTLLSYVRSNKLVVYLYSALLRTAESLRNMADEAGLLSVVDSQKGATRDIGQSTILREAQSIRLSLLREMQEDGFLSARALRSQMVWKSVFEILIEKASTDRIVSLTRLPAVLARVLFVLEYSTQQIYERGISQILSAVDGVGRVFVGLRDNYLPMRILSSLNRGFSAVRSNVQDIGLLAFFGTLKAFSTGVGQGLVFNSDLNRELNALRTAPENGVVALGIDRLQELSRLPLAWFGIDSFSTRIYGGLRGLFENFLLYVLSPINRNKAVGVGQELSIFDSLDRIGGYDRGSSQALALLSASGRQTVLIKGIGENFVLGEVGDRFASLTLAVSERFIIFTSVGTKILEGVHFYYVTVVELLNLDEAMLVANTFVRSLRENIIAFLGLDRFLELGRGSYLTMNILEGSSRRGLLTKDLLQLFAMDLAEDSSIQAVRRGAENLAFLDASENSQWLDRAFGERIVLTAFGGRRTLLNVGASESFSLFFSVTRYLTEGVKFYNREALLTLGLTEIVDTGQELLRSLREGILAFLGLDRIAELGRASLLGVRLEETTGRLSESTQGISEGVGLSERSSVLVGAVRGFGDMILALFGLDRDTESMRELEQAIQLEASTGRVTGSQKGVFELVRLRSTSLTRLSLLRGQAEQISFTSSFDSLLSFLRSPRTTFGYLLRLSIPSRQTLTVNIAQGLNVGETFSRAVSYWRGIFTSLFARISCFINGTHCDYSASTQQPGDGGGAPGDGGATPTPTPLVDGECTSWSACLDSLTTRECMDNGETWIEEEECEVIEEEGDKDKVQQTFVIKSTGETHYAEYDRDGKSIWLSTKMIFIYALILILFGFLIVLAIQSRSPKKSQRTQIHPAII